MSKMRSRVCQEESELWPNSAFCLVERVVGERGGVGVGGRG